MIFGEAVKLVVLALLFGAGKPGGGAGPSVPAGPFPAQKPEDLPAWPNGWCPDVPPPPEVVSRGWALMPLLWGKGEGTRQVEMVGGRWITFVATTVDGQKSVAAYRTVDCEPAPAVQPGWSPGVIAEQQADQAAKDLLNSAVAMNEALRLRGYKKSDMVHYQDFQRRAGLKVDGYPGAVTMLRLEMVLKGGGLGMAPVKIYPWKAGGAYDGVNAPTANEWEGLTVPAKSPIVGPTYAPSSGPPPIVPAVTPSPLTATWSVKSNMDVQHALNSIGYGPLTEDGIIGPQSRAAILSYQREHPPLAQDGVAGTQTKLALTNSLHSGEHRAAPGVLIPTSPATSVGPTISTPVDVQHALNLLSYKGADGKPLIEDGKIGPNSSYAIRSFQREHPPLAVDGIAGAQTKAALSIALARFSQSAAA